MRIRTAVIGVGSMGWNHARVYNELAEAELVAVADVNPVIARQAGQTYNIPWYTDYRQMLADLHPQAVSIAVPTAQHEQVALAAIESGTHVLIEKPIAGTIDEGMHIIEAARQAGLLLMIGHIVRFNPAVQALKQKLIGSTPGADGLLGRVFQVSCRRVGPFPERVRDVGVVIDLATHDLDLMRYLVGQDPLRVYAETEQRIHTAHEDLLLAVLRFPNQISGSLEINWLTPTKVREILVLGERGLLRVDDLTQDLYFYENAWSTAGSDGSEGKTSRPGWETNPSIGRNQPVPSDSSFANILWSNLQNIKGVREGSMVRFALQRFEPLKAELGAFLASIINEEPVPVSGEDGLAALRLALALVDSGRQHQVIEVTPDAQ